MLAQVACRHSGEAPANRSRRESLPSAIHRAAAIFVNTDCSDLGRNQSVCQRIRLLAGNIEIVSQIQTWIAQAEQAIRTLENEPLEMQKALAAMAMHSRRAT